MKNKPVIFIIIMLCVAFIVIGYTVITSLIPAPTNSAAIKAYDWWEYPKNPTQFPIDPNIESYMKIPKVELPAENELILEVDLVDRYYSNQIVTGWDKDYFVEYAVESDCIFIADYYHIMKYQNGKLKSIKTKEMNDILIQDIWVSGKVLFVLSKDSENTYVYSYNEDLGQEKLIAKINRERPISVKVFNQNIYIWFAIDPFWDTVIDIDGKRYADSNRFLFITKAYNTNRNIYDESAFTRYTVYYQLMGDEILGESQKQEIPHYMFDRKTGIPFEITSEFGNPHFEYLGEAGDRAYFKMKTGLYFKKKRRMVYDTGIAVMEDHKVVGYINDPPIKESKDVMYIGPYLQSDGNIYVLVQDMKNLKAYLYKLGMSKTRRNTLWDAIEQFGTPEPTEKKE